ncbi:MAG: hypothetical protein LBC51_06920 [Treponema sp.]|jgi:hypothetical protein|nr:hypothetical protein [Treponema sp.]
MGKSQGIFLIGGFCFVLGFLVSESFVLSQQQHKCCGEGCPVCLHLQWVQQVFKQFKYALTYHSLPARTLAPERLMVILVFAPILPFSGVRLKVKMNR